MNPAYGTPAFAPACGFALLISHHSETSGLRTSQARQCLPTESSWTLAPALPEQPRRCPWPDLAVPRRRHKLLRCSAGIPALHPDCKTRGHIRHSSAAHIPPLERYPTSGVHPTSGPLPISGPHPISGALSHLRCASHLWTTSHLCTTSHLRRTSHLQQPPHRTVMHAGENQELPRCLNQRDPTDPTLPTSVKGGAGLALGPCVGLQGSSPKYGAENTAQASCHHPVPHTMS